MGDDAAGKRDNHGGQRGGRKKRARYISGSGEKSGKGSAQQELQKKSTRGIFVSCDTNRDRGAGRELIDALRRIVGGPSSNTPDEKTQTTSEKPIAQALADELKEIRAEKATAKDFEQLDIGVKNIFFIRVAQESIDPEEVVSKLLLQAKAKPETSGLRYCIRIVPTEVTCYAGVHEAVKAAAPMISARLGDGTEETYGIRFRARNNTSAKREEFITALADAVPKSHKVDLSNPDVVFIVEIMQKTCCMSILRNFERLGKYNIRTIVEDAIKAEEKVEKDGQKGDTNPPEQPRDEDNSAPKQVDDTAETGGDLSTKGKIDEATSEKPAEQEVANEQKSVSDANPDKGPGEDIGHVAKVDNEDDKRASHNEK